MRFKIDWASLIVGMKFTVLLCFSLYLRAISKYKPPEGGGGAYIQRADLTEGFFDGLLDSLEHVFSRKNCKLLVHNFFQRKMKGHSKRVFFKILCPVVKKFIRVRSMVT